MSQPASGTAVPPTRLQFVRPFTTHVFNRFSRLFAGWLPGFALIEHTGRKSGTRYRTPMNVFRKGDDWILALTYGSDVQWLKNVQVAGGCRLVTRGRTYRLSQPVLILDPERSLMPSPVRQFLGLMRVTEFVRMTTVATDA